MVWKQSDRYYLRGVPVVENANIVTLQNPTREGYARPPFLLLDAFVHRDNPTESNHVLLEPDDTSDAYFVRKLGLDPTTGALSWSTDVSMGTFTLPVSAAALHSASGHVVAIHTDSGRMAFLHPVSTPRPQLARYAAGPGSQPGLLQSPTAIAVTNPGTVIILEAGASQLAAFDLNGNPVKYFGSNQGNFTQKLATSGTYLDLAVDGARHIYLLYYTGDGSQPDDYHIDVYDANGEPLVTHSPGANIARLAVDYWRSIYGVNFTGSGGPGVGGIAVPSISRLDPS
jgi:hypothetical protein